MVYSLHYGRTSDPIAKPQARITKEIYVEKLGSYLLKAGLITREQLEDALLEQKNNHMPLGRILSHNGKLRSIDLYQSLAKQTGYEFVDMLTASPQNGVINPDEVEHYLQHNYVPLSQDKSENMVVAAPTPSIILQSYLSKYYKKTVKLKLTSPFDLLWTLEKYCSEPLDEQAREKLYKKHPERSAKTKQSKRWKLVASSLCLAVIAGLILQPTIFIPAIIILFNLLFLTTLCFKFGLMLVGCHYPERWRNKNIRLLSDAELPVYTILVPIYKEAGIVPYLLNAIRNLDYPKSKMDVKIIVEADDFETIEAIKSANPEAMFEIIRTPFSQPQTKPKACNYALSFAKGELITIYDAEDRPHPRQLRLAASLFYQQCNNPIACLQARLNFYNRKEKLLSKLFAIEYSMLFDFVHPSLAKLGVPIPLGGTSNHMKMDVLRNIGDWDPYNVTEDADLGLRLSAEGWQTLPLDSETLEEAPISLGVWTKQRSRWIKGYLQTWLVYLRRPREFWKQQGAFSFISLQLFLGGASIIHVIAPVLWLLSLAYLLGFTEGLTNISEWLIYQNIGILILGMLVQWASAWLVVYRRGWDKMLPAIAIFPLYWWLHSFASFIAVYELFARPFYWHKTPHALSKMLDESL